MTRPKDDTTMQETVDHVAALVENDYAGLFALVNRQIREWMRDNVCTPPIPFRLEDLIEGGIDRMFAKTVDGSASRNPLTQALLNLAVAQVVEAEAEHVLADLVAAGEQTQRLAAFQPPIQH